MQRGERMAVIPKASTAAHRAANLAVFDFELSEQEMGAIGRLERGERLINPAHGPAWDG